MGSRALISTILSLKVEADSLDWQTREAAGFALRDLIEVEFDLGIRYTRDWVQDPSERIRRAACLACMQRKRFTTPQRLRVILQRLRLLMADDSLYVRKCCGPFVVGYLGYTYPSLSIPWLLTQSKRQNLNVRTNVAKAFSQALGGHFPKEALDILEPLAEDPSPRVRSAVAASLRNVLRRAPSYHADIQRRFASFRLSK
jgi:HEAT repeat protein